MWPLGQASPTQRNSGINSLFLFIPGDYSIVSDCGVDANFSYCEWGQASLNTFKSLPCELDVQVSAQSFTGFLISYFESSLWFNEISLCNTGCKYYFPICC